jgi:hypothetical protein
VDEAPQRTDAEGALMSGPPDYSTNPFLAAPQPGFIPAPDPGGLLSGIRQANPFQDGILLSPQEQAALAAAPRRPPGTEVTVRAKPVYWPIPLLKIPTGADHMFETFDDGQNEYVYRGGPQGALLHAQVDPAEKSPDFGADSRVLSKRFLYGKTADEAVAPARIDAARINSSGAPYLITRSNSNAVIGNFTDSQHGNRVGDSRTWGYDTGFALPFVPLDAPWP